MEEAALIAQLREALPSAMVPHRVVVLERCRGAGAHKVARDRLLYPESRDGDEADGEPPRDAELARLWAELLGVDAVYRQQELSAEGGHSLTAAELSIRIQSDLRRDVSVGDVLAHPVYGDLEDLVLERAAAEHDPIPVLDRSNGRGAPA